MTGGSPILAILFSLAIGLYIIWFCREAYRDPVTCRNRCFRWLPTTNLGIAVIRGWAVLCIFAGVLMIGIGIVSPFDPPKSLRLATLPVAAIIAAMLVPRKSAQ